MIERYIPIPDYAQTKVLNSTLWEGDAAILLEMTRRAFRNQEQSKQRSTVVSFKVLLFKRLESILDEQ